ncbi:unnamed protein product [Candida verbasci]|uniref:Alpha-1,2-mannosyltransferase n=1 Tax=Candida verbasci TaxID=1227364 RepID=A0A9W4U0Y4_9ASCO|nr:unnamed protein product [Candida verbasci]
MLNRKIFQSKNLLLIALISLITLSLLIITTHPQANETTKQIINKLTPGTTATKPTINNTTDSNSESQVDDDDDLHTVLPEDTSKFQNHLDFWDFIFKIFKKYELSKDIQPLIDYNDFTQATLEDNESRKALLQKADLHNVDKVKQLHKSVIDALPNKLSESVYKKGSTGIVTIGGGFYSWMAFLQILQLRKIGSTLPVELIIPSFGSYEDEFELCQEILPKYNAKCVIVPEQFGSRVMKNWSFGSYQYKALALVLSSFQHTLLLDSDNSPVVNPDSFFDQPVYKDNGLVLWPDYWVRSMSPKWYDMIDKPYSTEVKDKDSRFPLTIPEKLTPEQEQHTRFNDLKGVLSDRATESGQVLFNKDTHGKVALMVLYYNLFGPELYYKLFSLGALGEGDKDTFAAAALDVGKPYYQVHSHIKTLGWKSQDGEYHGMVMGQKNPQIDYELFDKVQKDLVSKNQNWSDEEKKLFDDDSNVPVFTLHCNIKKIHPPDFMKDKSIINDEGTSMNVRFYNSFKFMDKEGQELDFELERWKLVNKVACEDKIKFSIFKDQDMDKVCSFIKNSIDFYSKN